ncbi:Lyso-phosphatidylcholine acyltransferase [Stygiomarasmius scandens]|uniref:Tafazzin family protein n=1 Tax=Marasmiellus scandens TaxID=2682957 RepID=A0ABR1K2B2_9AGAR
MNRFLSAATITAVGLTCKAFCTAGLASLSVHGLENLQAALHSERRLRQQGIVTVSNHISTLDDPVTWAALPASYYLKSRLTRWTLGASDIMFTNPVFSTFFRYGQVLETFRGQGIYQPAVDTAIEKLDKGDWVHLYGEGKVNQPETYPTKDGRAVLPRFKWGVGRILSSTVNTPTIIPMWITGFDKLMPEGRPFPNKYLPRIGTRLSVTFGNPLSADEIKNVIERLSAQKELVCNPVELERRIRIEITDVVHRAVWALGRSVAGDSLVLEPCRNPPR